MKLDGHRTLPQNASGHKWFEQIAETLNGGGFTVNSKAVLKIDVPWTKESVKAFLFKPVMEAMYPEKTSTAQLTKDEWSQIVEALNLALGERVGIHVDYPTGEE